MRRGEKCGGRRATAIEVKEKRMSEDLDSVRAEFREKGRLRKELYDRAA